MFFPFLQLFEIFIYVLQGAQNGRHVSDCHSLWQELRQLSRKMGDCFCYVYGTVIVIWFVALTLSLYGGLIGIFNHGIHLKWIALLGSSLMCITVLFVISDAGQRVCQEVSNVIVHLYLMFIGPCNILIVFIITPLLLNMFRMLVLSSSGACDLLWIYFMCCIALVRCVLVLRCGSAGVVWYPYAG